MCDFFSQLCIKGIPEKVVKRRNCRIVPNKHPRVIFGISTNSKTEHENRMLNFHTITDCPGCSFCSKTC